MTRKHRARMQVLKGLLFIGPNLVGFCAFVLFPMLFSLVLAFSKWNMYGGLTDLTLVGLKNFRDVLTDGWFYESLRNNLVFLLSIPITMALAFAVAICIEKVARIKGVLRAAFFIPYVTSLVAMCYVWMMLFQPTFGLVNNTLRALGIQNVPGWLSSSQWALPTIMMLNVWMNIGYNMVIFISGLKAIPKEVEEAATIDGATGFQSMLHVTIPLLSPMTFFLMITGIINSFKMFAPINIMTNGGPGTATSVLVYQVYISAFQFAKTGYAAAVTWVLFAIILFITLAQWAGQKKWVNYL